MQILFESDQSVDLFFFLLDLRMQRGLGKGGKGYVSTDFDRNTGVPKFILSI